MGNSTTDQLHPYLFHPKYLSVFTPITIFSLLTSSVNFFTIRIMLRTKSLSGAGNYPIVSILVGSAAQSLLTVPTYTFKRLNDGHLHREGFRWLCDFYRLPYFIWEHGLKVCIFVFTIPCYFSFQAFINFRAYRDWISYSSLQIMQLTPHSSILHWKRKIARKRP